MTFLGNAHLLFDAKMFIIVPTLIQWRSQNAEKIPHIKGRLLDQVMFLFNCALFKMGTSLKGKNSLPEEAIFFLYK